MPRRVNERLLERMEADGAGSIDEVVGVAHGEGLSERASVLGGIGSHHRSLCRPVIALFPLHSAHRSPPGPIAAAAARARCARPPRRVGPRAVARARGDEVAHVSGAAAAHDVLAEEASRRGAAAWWTGQVLLRASGRSRSRATRRLLSAPADAGLSEALRAAGLLAAQLGVDVADDAVPSSTKLCRRGATTPTTLSCSPRRGLLYLSRRSPSRPTPGGTSPASQSTRRAGTRGSSQSSRAASRSGAPRTPNTPTPAPPRSMRWSAPRRHRVPLPNPPRRKEPATTTALPRRPLLLSALALPLLLAACSGAWSETTVPDSAFTEMPTGREDAEELFLAADQAFRSGDAVSAQRLFDALHRRAAPPRRRRPSGIQATCDTMGVDCAYVFSRLELLRDAHNGRFGDRDPGSRGSGRTSPTSRTATRRR